jgi:hypothetical protein
MFSGMTQMSEWREWDFPPDRHRASHRPAQPALDLHMRVERDDAGYLLQPRRKLGDRIWHAYGRAMIGLAKLIVGAVAGIRPPVRRV